MLLVLDPDQAVNSSMPFWRRYCASDFCMLEAPPRRAVRRKQADGHPCTTRRSHVPSVASRDDEVRIELPLRFYSYPTSQARHVQKS